MCECYDYTGHLVWQWWAPELWRRFTIALRRQLARHLGLSETATRQLVRVQFAKVAEYQRRGVIHFHALIRLDGPPTDLDTYPPPAVAVDSAILADLVRAAAGQSPTPPRRSTATTAAAAAVRRPARRPPGHRRRRPGTHGAQLHPETVAAYIAKYATKAAADLPTDHTGGNGHLRRLQATLRQLAGRAAFAALAGGRAAVPGLGPVGRHARLPRPPRHQVPPLLR